MEILLMEQKPFENRYTYKKNMQKLKSIERISKGDSIVLSLDTGLTCTGVTLSIEDRSYICAIYKKGQNVNPIFNEMLYESDIDEDEHQTLVQHSLVNNLCDKMEIFIKSVLHKYNKRIEDITVVKLESLAMSQMGKSSRIIDLALVLSVIIQRLKGLGLRNIKLVSAHTIKKNFLGTKKEQDAKYGAKNPSTNKKWETKDKMLLRFKEVTGYDVVTVGKKNDDAVDSWVIGNYC